MLVTSLPYPTERSVSMFRTAEFRSTFANNWQFDENENPIAPGVRELADTIARELESRANVVSLIEQHSYYAWSFEAKFAGCRFVNVLNPGDEACYLTVQLCWYGARVLLLQRPRKRFDTYCSILEASLAAIQGVSDVVWQPYRS